MTFQTRLETKSATELSTEDGATEVKTALDALAADVNTKTAPVADLTKRLDTIEAKLARPSIHTKADKDEAQDLEAKALNSFLRNGTAALDENERKTLNIGTQSAGGYAVAPIYSTTIIEKLTQLSPMRSLASVVSVGSGKIYIPTLTADANGGWVTETGSRPSSEPTFGQVEIDAFEHAVVVPVSQQLLEDSFVDLQAFHAGHIAKRFAKAEDAFVTGDGNGKPTGFLNTPSAFEQVVADQDGSDLLDKLIELFYTLPSDYAARSTWAMTRKTVGLIRAAADNATKGTIWSDSLANGTPARFLGAPVAEFPSMDELASGDSPAGDTYPVALADFGSMYQVIDRVGIQLVKDELTGADTGVVKFRARRRVGGKVILPEAGVVLKGVA